MKYICMYADYVGIIRQFNTARFSFFHSTFFTFFYLITSTLGALLRFNKNTYAMINSNEEKHWVPTPQKCTLRL